MNKKEVLYARVCQQWHDFLVADGKVDTFERRTILLRILENKSQGAFSPMDVMEWIANDHISTATVYNTLNLMVHARILQRLRQGVNSTKMLYEFAHGDTNHMQIICTRCGRVANVRDATVQRGIQTKQYRNFIPEHYSVYIFGVCEECEHTKYGRK